MYHSMQGQVCSPFEPFPAVLALELSLGVCKFCAFHQIVGCNFVNTFEMFANFAVLLGWVIVHFDVIVQTCFTIEWFVTEHTFPGGDVQMPRSHMILNTFQLSKHGDFLVVRTGF